MKSLDIETLDSIYIAKFILGKLGVSYDANNESKLFSEKAQPLRDTIQAIENIEEVWQHLPAENTHTFGRKEQNEVIKLWSVPKKSAEVLENLVVLTGAKCVLEVGTSAGYAALHLASGAQVKGGKVYTIEILEEKITLAQENFKRSSLQNIVMLKGEASEHIKNWQGDAIDFVFLDADKENYGKYLDLLLPKMKIGGLIVADNINDYGHMMEDYLQKVSGTHLPNSRVDKRVRSYYLAALDNGLMITQKIAD